MSPDHEALIVCLVKDNTRKGYDKIHGELLKHGHRLGVTSVRIILLRQLYILGGVIHDYFRQPPPVVSD